MSNQQLEQRVDVRGSITTTHGVSLAANTFENSTVTIHNADASRRPVHQPWTVPRNYTHLFAGRQDVLERLAAALSPHTPQDPDLQRRVVIHGLAGVGKTEVALRFANDHRDDYWGVFWVDCATPQSALVGFARIARLFRLSSDKVADVKSWLSSKKEQWLLVLDNADDHREDYSAYQPSGTRGDILITTRNAQLCRSTDVLNESLSLLSVPVAKDLLLKSAGLVNLSAAEDDAEALVQKLGLHTLAIRQAGAYLQNQGCQISEYLDEYEAQLEELFKFEADVNRTEARSVHATFEISVNQIHLQAATEDRQDAVDALDVLKVLPFIHFESRLGHILSLAASYAAELNSPHETLVYRNGLLDTGSARLCPKYAPASGHGMRGQSRWRNACRLLQSYSMLAMHDRGPEETIATHPLVHSWLKHRLSPPDQQSGWLVAGTILALSMQGCSELGPESTFLRSHVRAWLCQDFSSYASFENLEAILPASLQVLWMSYHENDDFMADELIEFFKKVIKEDEKSRPSEIPIATMMAPVPILNLPRSEPAQIDLRLEELKSELESLDAMWMHIRGRDEEALPILQRVCKKRKSTMLVSQSEVLAANQRLATVYRNVGKPHKAVEILQDVTSIKSQILPRTHPSRLETEYELALAYSFAGQAEKAVEIFEQMASIEQDSLPHNHISLLQTKAMLLEAYADNGQFDEAERLLNDTLSAFNDVFAQTNEHWLSATTVGARINAFNGNLDDAMRIYKLVLDIRKQSIPDTHMYILGTMCLLGSTYIDAGRPQEAIELFEHVVSVRAMTLHVRSPDLLDAQAELARAYLVSGGDRKRAVELLESVASHVTRRSYLPSTLLMLGQAYLADGQIEKALSTLKAASNSSSIFAETAPVRIRIARLLEQIQTRLETDSSTQTND